MRLYNQSVRMNPFHHISEEGWAVDGKEFRHNSDLIDAQNKQHKSL